MPTRLHLDFETFSEADLKKVGLSRYARHASTEVLMLAWAVGNDPVQQWVPCEDGPEIPRDLVEMLRDPEFVKIAWNAPFERAIFRNVLDLDTPCADWRDTMVLSYTLSLPGKLETAGEVVGLPADKKKMSRGSALIRRFCVPRKPTKTKPHTRGTVQTDPADWEEFKQYNRIDVEAERAIWKRIAKWNLSPEEWALWVIDQEINDAGIPINMAMVQNARAVAAAVVEARLAEMAEITGLANPNSGAQLLPWLQENGYPFVDLKKGHIARAANMPVFDDEEVRDFLGQATVPDYRRVLELRAEVSKTSVKKYDALADRTDDDGLIRGTLQFAGAGRTWRWAGRNGYQPQNLARPTPEFEKCQEQSARSLELLCPEAIELVYAKPMDLLSSCVRPAFKAPPGYRIIDADLNAIENRVLGWMAEDQKILDVYEQDRDPYVDFSTYMVGGTYDQRWAEFKAGDKSNRTMAKPGVLGCGYMLGAGKQFEDEQTGEIEATGLLGYAWNMGVRLTPEQSELSVRVWRETFSDAVQFWWAIDKAARRCITTGQATECGPLAFDMSGPFMRMRLPSGRCLHYCRPAIKDMMKPWGEIGPTITYEGLNDKNQWSRQTTHPGKLTENADQAISRDVLAHGIRLAKKEGLDVRLHVHDQIAALSREDRADEELEILKQCMSEVPAWAKGLPLATAGFHSDYFIKD